MVAMLLAACGLDLGRMRDLSIANADNPLGFWEDLRFVALNDAILARAGGSWERPPARVLPPARSLGDRWLARRARRLLARAAPGTAWGWKDPRTALTLPFWTALAPDLRVVVCLRHPGAVAASLERRRHRRSDDGEALWRVYNRRLLAAAPPERRIVVSYEAMLADPRATFAPVLDFAGLPAAAAASLDTDALVLHGRLANPSEPPPAVAAESDALYRLLLDEAACPVGVPPPAPRRTGQERAAPGRR